MPVYGYKSKVLDKKYGLLELREVSLELQPGDLRRIARFLDHYAGEIESGSWRGDHIHIESFDPAWRADHPEADLLILNPDPDQPKVVEKPGK